MNKNYIIGGALVFFVIVIGAYVFMHGGTTVATHTEPVPAPVAQPATSTYATTSFSVVYPAAFSADKSYVYDQVNPKKPIHGVKFSIPLEMATGTNLSIDSGVAIEQLPHAKKCTGDIYLHDNVRANERTDNGVTYSVASSSGAGAGNFYEETVYAITGSVPCTAVRYFIHSTNIGNYDPGTVKEFNRAALLASFDKIRQALVLIPTTTP